MSIVHVVVPDGVDDPAAPSGGNTYDRRLCQGLAELGWQVHVDAVPRRSRVGPADPHAPVAEPGSVGEPRAEVPQDTRAAFTAAGLTAVLARVPSGRVVLVDGLVATGHPEVLEPESARLRLVVLVHLPLGLGRLDDEDAGLRRRESAALRAVAGVVTTSRWSRRWLLDAYGLDPARVVAATPGVDAVQPVSGGPAGSRLLCVGAVLPAKGQDALVEALGALGGVDWCCELVGSVRRDPVFADRVRQRAADLGVAHRVRFSGPLDGSSLDAAYARADLLVTASRLETYGMVVTEALARGIPVLATRVGGLPEAMGRAPGERRPGILVPVDDPGALAGALEQWLGDPALRRHLRQAALDRREALPRWSATALEVAAALAAAAH